MDKALYSVTTDATELIAGTSNRVMTAYVEAAKVTAGEDIQRSLAYLKSFANSIDRVAKQRGRDPILMATAGNIKNVKNYETLTKSLDQLSSFLGINAELSALRTIHDSLVKYQALYSDGYKAGIPLITYEYEAAASTLIRGVSVLIVTQVDPQLDGVGKMRFNKVSRQSGGVFTKVAKDIAKELRVPSHGEYLKQLIEMTRNPDLKVSDDDLVTESVIDTIADGGISAVSMIVDIFKYGWKGVKTAGKVWKMVVRSMFGIIPLIRTVIYLHYKRKADIVGNLELQAQYVELNIKQLETMKNMDPEKKAAIIKKQQAYVAAYRKKAEKLRAELVDSEREGSKALATDKTDASPSGDYVLD